MARSYKYFATRKFRYNDYHVEPGELFSPAGAPNDAVLIGAGYLRPIEDSYPTSFEPAKCLRCNKVFVEGTYKFMHDQACPPQRVSIPEQVLSYPGEATTEV